MVVTSVSRKMAWHFGRSDLKKKNWNEKVEKKIKEESECILLHGIQKTKMVFLCFQFNDFVCELKYNFSLFWECLRVHVVGYFCPLIIQQVFTEIVKCVILLSSDSVITKCHSL